MVYFLRKYLFLLKVSISSKNLYTILYNSSNLFKSYNLKKLLKKDKKIKFPIVKYHGNQPKLNILQIFTQNNFRSWFDFVFTISTFLFNKKIILKISLAVNISFLSSNSTICKIAIVVEVEANFLQTLFAAIKNQ